MKLPQAHAAIVPEQKITHYLLNPAHPAGGSKAAFFLRHGFTRAQWPRLAEALLRHGQENEVVATEPNPPRHPLCYRWAACRAGRCRLERPQRVVY